MTLEETADLLRVPVGAVLGLAVSGQIPGRRIAGEWRFVSEAVIDWLSMPSPPVAGVRRDFADEDPEEIIAAIYAERKKVLVGDLSPSWDETPEDCEAFMEAIRESRDEVDRLHKCGKYAVDEEAEEAVPAVICE